jgi:glycosyltransferase involved in cell wall biosynthesis
METTPKKRILFVITQSEWGGAQKFLYSLVSNLDISKYEILVSTGDAGDGKLLDAFKKMDVQTRKLRSLKRQINPYFDLKAISELKNLIKEFKPDVIFLNSSKAGIVGAIASKGFPNLKVIYRIGGWAFNDPLPWLMQKFYIFAERYTAKFKDHIIVNNRHDFEQAKKLNIKPRQKLELIYNGIDPYRLEFVEKNEAKQKLTAIFEQKQKNLPQSALVIGTIANFYRTKGLTYLIQAAKLFYSKNISSNAVFVIIGDGPERTILETEIKNNGLGDKVFLAGTLPDAYRYLTAMDIFVLPSVKEGFPWALLEAMSAKLPVIATNVGANPEIIENGKNGLLVKPGKPAEIVSALEALMADENLRRELGIQAHQTVIKKFDQNKMLEKIESLF